MMLLTERVIGMGRLKIWLNEVTKRLSYHPIHVILGLVSCTIGIYLICSENYYFWPPFVIKFFNSACIGTWAFFTGLGLILSSLQRIIPNSVNNALLISQCAFVGGEAFLEFAHGIIANNNHMITLSFAMFGYLLITFWVIRTDGNFNHKTTQRIKERDNQIGRR